MIWLWKLVKGLFIFGLISGLVFASSVFTVLFYAKVTGQYDEVFENDAEPVVFAKTETTDPSSGGEELDASAKTLAAEKAADADRPPKKPRAMLDAPLIQQYPELPRGCEVTSLTMLFQYYGIDKNKMELAQEMKKDPTPLEVNPDGSIRFWGDPNSGFVGDITLNGRGFGIYHKALSELLKKYIPTGVDLTGSPFATLEEQVSRGIPVVVWTTTNYRVPERWVEWDSPNGPVRTTFSEHAVLLVGYDEKHVYVNDPLKSAPKVKVDRQQFIESYIAMGKQALSYE